MDEVVNNEKDQLVPNENEVVSLVSVCLSTSGNSRHAKTSKFCIGDMEPAVMMKLLPYSQVENQAHLTSTEPPGDEELADRCLNHDPAESGDSINCFGQDVLLYQQCLVPPDVDKHVANHLVSNKGRCLIDSHRESGTGELKSICLISVEDNIMNHISNGAGTVHSRNDFITGGSNEAGCFNEACFSNEVGCFKETGCSNKAGCPNETGCPNEAGCSNEAGCFNEADFSNEADSNEADCLSEIGCSNEETRHLLNSKAETRLQKHTKPTATDTCCERDGSCRSHSASDQTHEYKNHCHESDANSSDQNMAVCSSSIHQTSLCNIGHHTLSNFDNSFKNVSNCKVTFDGSFFQEQIENKSEEQSSLTVLNDQVGNVLLPDTCEGVDGVHQVMEDGSAPAVMSGGGLYGGEQQGSMESLTENSPGTWNSTEAMFLSTDSLTQNNPTTQNLTLTSEGMFLSDECQSSSVTLTQNNPSTQNLTLTSEGMFFSAECQGSSVSFTKISPMTQASTLTSEGMLFDTDCHGSSVSLAKTDLAPQTPTFTSEGMFFSTHCQGTSISLTKNDSLMQTSFVGPELIQARLPAPESLLPDSKGGKSLLNPPKQNRGAPNLNSRSNSPESACKVVTKYVFINKSLKSSTNKKRFGILYRQAFRHFHGAKLQKKKQKKKKKKPIVKENIKKKEPATRKTVPKKSIVAVCVNPENELRNQNKEARNKSRGERRLARELRKSLTKDINKEMTERNKEKRKRKKDREHEVIEACRGKVVSAGAKRRRNSKKSQNFEDSNSIIQTSANLEETKNVVKAENGITRQHVLRIKKKEIHGANEKSSHGKKRKTQRRIHIDKGDIEVKEEIVGRDIKDNNVGVDESCQQGKIKMRNRKDLTLQEKVQAIKALDMPGSKFVTVAKKFGVSVSAISRINKNRELITLQAVSGDLNRTQRRSRECKDPELDKGLLRWFRTIEHLYANNGPVGISNVLLKEKACELAVAMGKNYFPSDNWIIRWKNRHNIGMRSSSTTRTITDREELRQLDVQVNLSDVLHDMEKQDLEMGLMKHESLAEQAKKPDDLFICEHCGVLMSTKKKKGSSHLPGCPELSVRKDLTLEEKVQVVQALEQPGVKMVTLAKKYGVSASAISRINKNRVDILARRASGLANSARRRDRGSKEPEVEKLLCEWFKVQLQLGIHISGSMIREKARDIAKVMGKEFWPSESWVFRWRHRNNVTDINTFLYGDGDEGELGNLGRNNDNAEDVTLSNSIEEVLEDKSGHGDKEDAGEMAQLILKKKSVPVNGTLSTKQFRLPLSVMCEKCGYVSYRVKNNRIKSLRHAKGCPDLKQRNEHTYENRARMLKALDEPGATLSSVARQFGVSVSSMSRMNQKKDQIFLHSEDHATQKRIRDCKEPEVAYTLYQWYMQKKASGIHVPGPKLKEKAKKIAADYGREFNASSGWLGRWRHRYNIISSVRKMDYIPKNCIKKKKLQRYEECKIDSSEDLAQLQEIPHEFHQNSVGSSESVVGESIEAGHLSQLPQTTPVFIHQRFQNPWEIAQQHSDSCVWTKDFLTPAGSGVLDESAVSVAYTYGDTVKPVFHNMFDSFSTVGYQVALPLNSSVVMSQDYLKPDMNEDKCGPSGTLLPQLSHSSHSQLSHHLASNLTSQHHLQHLQITHQQPPHVQPHPQMNLSLPPASPVPLDDDPEQQRQVMEALKIMSSFAQKKCLGDQVQAALRTIEMSMKGPPRKTSTRHTYTAI